MKDNLSIIISMIIFVILIVIFPLYNYFERQDDMSYNLALKTTTNFVDEVTNAGYLDQDMYNRFVDELANTGNVYDIQLEAHKRILTQDATSPDIYNEQYLIDYNNQIFSSGGDISSNLNERTIKDNAYYLNEGDQFYVKLKNSNTTMAGAIFNTIVPASSKDRIVVNYGGIIKNEAWAKVDATYRDVGAIQSNIPSILLTAVENSGGSRENKNQVINSNQTIEVCPSNQYFCFKASGPGISNWWNNSLSGYIWSYEYTDNAGNVTNSSPSTQGVDDEYKFNSNAAEGTYRFSVKAKDLVGNTSDPINFQIKVETQIDDKIGDFTEKYLNIETNEFSNLYPKVLDLTVYLGNAEHIYSADTIEVFGISDSGLETSLVKKDLRHLAGQKKGNANKIMSLKTASSEYEIISECKITKLSSYAYNGRTFNNVLKINTKFTNFNKDNRYKKLKIIFENSYSECVLSDTINGTYEYKLEYGN